MKKYRHIFIIFSLLIGSSWLVQGQESNHFEIYYTNTKFVNPIPFQGNKIIDYSFQTIQLANGTYGYQIFADRVLILEQKEYPGKGDGNGFKTAKQAELIARMVIAKLENPVIPPIVSTTLIQRIFEAHHQ